MTDTAKLASVDMSGIMTRSINTDKHVQYQLRTLAEVATPTDDDANATTLVERVLNIDLRADDKDKWVAEFAPMRGTNRDDASVLTKGYKTEKAGDRKPVFDHVFIALGRQLATFADDVDSVTVAKNKSVAALTDENARLKAQLRAMGLLTGSETSALSDTERSMLTPDLLALVDAKMSDQSEDKKKAS